VFIGGSCAETEVSAIASAQVALAVEANQVLAKPGMGVDEGVTIVRNAMRRALVDWERTS
jgi:methylaspartate ammonia-lyase